MKKLMLAFAATAAVLGVFSVHAADASSFSKVVSIKNSALQTSSTLVLPSNAFSIGAWVKSSWAAKKTDAVYIYHSDTAICRFQSNEDYLHLMVLPSSGNWVKTYATGVTRDMINDGQWHFIFTTFNYDAGDASACTQRLYVDGVLKASSTTTAPVKAPAYKLTFCARRDGAGDDMVELMWASGRIGELTFWNRALTGEEVAKLFAHVRVGGKEDGLVSWWPLGGETVTCDNCSQSDAKAGGALVKTSRFGTASLVEDMGLAGVRYVASPEWIAEHGYIKPAGATFRGLDDPATSIQEAIDAASNDEFVRLLPGVYPVEETVKMSAKRLVLESYNPQTGAVDRDGTVLDGQKKVRILYCGVAAGASAPDTPFLVRGLTIRNGNKSDGSGSVYLRGDASTAAGLDKRGGIVDCVFSNCTASSSGGAVYIVTGGFVSNCVFRSNTAKFGGAIAVFHSATDYGSYTTTLQKESLVPAVYNCVFESNHTKANGCGGAVSYRDPVEGDPDHCIIIKNSVFRNNYAADISGRGGAVCAGWNSVIYGCTFSGKSNSGDYGLVVDMRGHSVGTHALFSNNTITGVTNTTLSAAGLIEMHGVGYTIENCVVTNNLIAGSVIRVAGNGTGGVVRQCLFANNGSSSKAMRGFYTGTVRFENCTVDGDDTGFLAAEGTQRYELVNTIVRSNRLIESTGTKTFAVQNSLLPNIPGGAEDSGVMTGDPRFTDAAHGNYLPRRSSPCRDKALPLAWMTGARDLAGAPRVVLNGVVRDDNLYADVGCFENCLKPGGLIIVIE